MAQWLLYTLVMRMLFAGLVMALAPSLAFGQSGGAREITIDGRTLSCGNARIVQDRNLDNLGMAVPDRRLIIINPALQQNMSAELKWFIFYHECGHVEGHLNEIKADEYAVARATAEGWLTADVLNQICRSWGPMDAPAGPFHPAPRVRCRAVLASADRHRPSPTVGTMVTQGPTPPTAPRRDLAAVPRPPTPSGGSTFMMDDDVVANR